MLDIFNRISKIVPEAYNLGNIKVKPFDKVLVCGMGGSGFPGYLLKDLVDIPIFVAQSYTIPGFIDKNTLTFIISYSGNTEETISMLKSVRKKTKNIVIITSGGKLVKEKETKIIVPKGMEPRDALPYLFFPMWKILGKGEIKEVITTLKRIKIQDTKKLAGKIKDKIPAIYASREIGALAFRWKTQFNEDAKVLSIANIYPEMNHNEIEADFRKAFSILLRDNNDHPRIKKRMDLTKKRINAIEITLKGKSKVARMFYGIYFGDFTAYHLALFRKKDPYKYEFIEKLKEKLKNV